MTWSVSEETRPLEPARSRDRGIYAAGLPDPAGPPGASGSDGAACFRPACGRQRPVTVTPGFLQPLLCAGECRPGPQWRDNRDRQTHWRAEAPAFSFCAWGWRIGRKRRPGGRWA